MVKKGFYPSRARAQEALKGGLIRVGGRVVTKASTTVEETDQVTAEGDPIRFVGRGGLKLEGALIDFGVEPAGRICLDVGASTGGFTQCLLVHGARMVYSVDVGRDQLHPDLRADRRVVVMEGTDIRSLSPGQFPEAPELATVDVSFIGLEKILPPVRAILAPGGEALLLVKPQFQSGRGSIGKGGLVRDPQARARAVSLVIDSAEAGCLSVVGQVPSRVPGGDGNQEFFLHLRLHGQGMVEL